MAKRENVIPTFKSAEELGCFLLVAILTNAKKQRAEISVNEISIFNDVKFEKLNGKRINLVVEDFKFEKGKLTDFKVEFGAVIDKEVIFNFEVNMKSAKGSLFCVESEYLGLKFSRYKRLKTESQREEFLENDIKNNSTGYYKFSYIQSVLFKSADAEWRVEFLNKLEKYIEENKTSVVNFDTNKNMEEKEMKDVEKKIAEDLRNGNYETVKCLNLNRKESEDIGNKVTEKIINDGIGAIIGGIASVRGNVKIKGNISIKVNADVDFDMSHYKENEGDAEPIKEKVSGKFNIKDTGLSVDLDLELSGDVDANVNGNADIK